MHITTTKKERIFFQIYYNYNVLNTITQLRIVLSHALRSKHKHALELTSRQAIFVSNNPSKQVEEHAHDTVRAARS